MAVAGPAGTSNEATPRVEILIHVSAPSGGQDDARYRQQAAAYLGFQGRVQGGQSIGRLQLHQPDQQRVPYTVARALKDTPVARGLGQQATTPVIQVVRSEIFKKRKRSSDGLSHLPRSRPRTPTGRGEETEASPGLVVDSQPCLFRPHQLTHLHGHGKTHPTDHSPSPSIPLPISTCSSPSGSSQAKSSPPLTLFPPSSSPIPAPDTLFCSTGPSQAFHLLTPSFETLLQTLPLSKHYRPVSVSRTLGQFERGHWSVVTWDLPSPVLQRLWRFLADFIRGGRAGWGIWATREGEAEDAGTRIHSTVFDPNARPATTGRSTDVGQMIQLFGWGGLASELYMLLFLASERRIKGIGARWMDMKGRVVIQMP